MSRQDQANDQFSLTSFLYGGNADYIEDLYARYKGDPSSVGVEWQDFFGALQDDANDVKKNAEGASWTKPNWPIAANGELVSALDGDWGVVEKHFEKKVKEKAAWQNRSRTTTNFLRNRTASQPRIMTAVSSSIMCWGWNTRPSARCSTY